MLIGVCESARLWRERQIASECDPRIKSAGFAYSVRFGLLHRSVLRRPGGNSEEPIPDPIPNSAVKVLRADGTKSQGLEE